MKIQDSHRFINRRALGALALALIFIATANAQPNITWQTPVTISGTSDVNTSGTLYGTWAPGDDWGGLNRSDYFPVNGVRLPHTAPLGPILASVAPV